jgi:hypothetical protein
MPLAAAAPAIIMAGGSIASAAIAKKKSAAQKQMEALQVALTQHQAARQKAMEPAQDSIMRAYASMISPEGGFDPSSLHGLSGTQPASYYGTNQGTDPFSSWWGTTPVAGGGGPSPVPQPPSRRGPPVPRGNY